MNTEHQELEKQLKGAGKVAWTMLKKQRARAERLLPEGKPRYIRCYDNGGESFDRYTVVYTGRWAGKSPWQCFFVGMSANPFHPQGYGQHGEAEGMIDRPSYGHLGKRIKFDDLPADCQRLVLTDYIYLWNIESVELEGRA